MEVPLAGRDSGSLASSPCWAEESIDQGKEGILSCQQTILHTSTNISLQRQYDWRKDCTHNHTVGQIACPPSPAPKDAYTIMPGTRECLMLPGKRDFLDVVKVADLKIGTFSWAICLGPT